MTFIQQSFLTQLLLPIKTTYYIECAKIILQRIKVQKRIPKLTDRYQRILRRKHLAHAKPSSSSCAPHFSRIISANDDSQLKQICH